MQGRKPKLTFPSAVELRFSNYSNIVLINSSLILDNICCISKKKESRAARDSFLL